MNIRYQLSQAEIIFEDVAFLIAKGASAKDIHSNIIKGLIVLSDIKKSILTQDIKEEKPNQSESDEVEKVQRRLKLWSKPERQQNINSQILNAFLKLRQSGEKHITEIDIQNKLKNVDDFKNNFDQMKNIAEKNHGKVFEQNGGQIEIWEPVSLLVSEYEITVFQKIKPHDITNHSSQPLTHRMNSGVHSMEQKFKNWLIKQGYSEPGAVNSYPQAIPKISEHYSRRTGKTVDIYSVTDQNIISQIAHDYSQSGQFAQFGYEQHSRYRAAISRYSEFFAYKG